MISRRCSERRFFMRPDRETNNAFIYCLALASHRYNIAVIFTAAMSNHHHTGIIDRDGRLPEFLAYFHKLFAKHQNALRGRWENFWAPEQPSAVELVTLDDVLDKMVYAITNPVKDHLVAKARHWPGVDCFAAIEQDVPLVASKPLRFFRPDNDLLPDVVTLELVRPPGFEHLAHDAWVEDLHKRIASVEAAAETERTRCGARVLGRQGVRKQRWRDRPTSREPRRQLSPRVACRDKWRRIEALARNRAFIAAYRAARAVFVVGKPAFFPLGTFWLTRYAGACCSSVPAPS
jgi:hypothetical protein